MPHIRIYLSETCPYCIAAERLLKSKNTDYQRIVINNFNPVDMRKLADLTGKNTVPQIYINEQHIGGYSDLLTLEHNGQLADLLQHDE